MNSVVRTDTDAPTLPDWLAPTTIDSSSTPTNALVFTRTTHELELTRQAFPAFFERALEWIAGGDTLTDLIREDYREIDKGAFNRWIHSNRDRLRRWEEAKRIGCESVEDRLIQIADGSLALEDVQRSSLRVNTLKWLLGVWDRKRYGEVKQVDVTATINIHQALKEARGRVIEGSVVKDSDP